MQSGPGGADAPPAQRDHLPEKEGVHLIALRDGPHLRVHFPENEVRAPLEQPQVHLGAGELLRAGQLRLQQLDGLRLPGGDALGQAADSAVVGHVQKVPAQPDRRAVLGEELGDVVAGNALGEARGGDALDHPVQDLIAAAQVTLGLVAEQISISHGFALLLPIL